MKTTIKEPFTFQMWATKALTFNYLLLGAGLHGAADRGTAALISQVNHTVRGSYEQEEMC